MVVQAELRSRLSYLRLTDGGLRRGWGWILHGQGNEEESKRKKFYPHQALSVPGLVPPQDISPSSPCAREGFPKFQQLEVGKKPRRTLTMTDGATPGDPMPSVDIDP